MDVGNSDALIQPVPPEPFALIADMTSPVEAVEASLRRMGLKPERLDDAPGAAAELIAAPRFRLSFGALSVLAGPAAAAALDFADPGHPSTSQLAASLPPKWRMGGECWIFIHEPERAPSTSPPARPTQMREFFKTMVLLIDLFDASHIFWSPARLWSDAPQFRASIAEMLVSGMPPVLHLVAFRRKDLAEGSVMATRGLTLFAGQELEARVPDGWTAAEMVRRLSRLALDMMLNGPIREARSMRGLESGEWIDLLPPLDGKRQRSTVVVEFGRDG